MAVLCSSFSSSSAMRAAPPFDSKDANVVLRSSDNVDFKVHKHIIKLASPVLAAFISLAPSPPPPPSASRRHHMRRIVELSDPSEFLDMFLRFVYPVPEPLLALDDVATVLELSHKYDSSTVTSRMRTHLLRPEFLESDPLQVYALASFAGMDDVVQIAARHTLPHPPPRPAHLTEKRMLPGAALLRLLDYRQRCVAAATRVARIENATVPWWLQLQWQRFCFLSECGWECAKLPRRTLKWRKRLHECVEVPEYWIEYMNAVGTALGDTLDPAVARDRELLRQAAEKAAGCSKCAGRVVWDLQEFGEILEDAIGEAIAGVSTISTLCGL